jgi:hypothetical protein
MIACPRSRKMQLLLFILSTITAIAYFRAATTNRGHDEEILGDTAKDYQQPEGGAARNRPLFPGMNDDTTKLECCPARIIVELERAYAANKPLPHSLLMYNDSESMCGSFIESIENVPSCCGLPPDLTDDGPGALTIPEWVEHCVLDYAYQYDLPINYTGFMFYYDGCPAPLKWQNRSCSQWMASLVDDPSRDLTVLQTNLALVEGNFQGTVVEFLNQRYSNRKNVTSIFVADVFDSCWQIDCGFNKHVTEEKCIDFAQENLVQVNLENYVNITKRIWCE